MRSITLTLNNSAEHYWVKPPGRFSFPFNDRRSLKTKRL